MDRNPLDLVVVNSQLPDASVEESIVELKRNERDLPVLVVIPFEGSKEGSRAENSGCQGLIPKPVKPNILLDLIARSLA
jgi:DNA-binding NarL/FixJ family response regulator